MKIDKTSFRSFQAAWLLSLLLSFSCLTQKATAQDAADFIGHKVARHSGVRAKVSYTEGVSFRDRDPRSITLDGGRIRVLTGSDKKIRMNTLVVASHGGTLDSALAVWPAVKLLDGGILTNLYGSTLLNVTGNGKLRMQMGGGLISGKFGELSLSNIRPPSYTGHRNHSDIYLNGDLTVDKLSGQHCWIYQNTGRLTVGELSLGTGIRLYLDWRREKPLVVKRVVPGSYFGFRFGTKKTKTFTKPFIVVDNQGSGPLPGSDILEGHPYDYVGGDLGPPQHAKWTSKGGDGNDWALIPVVKAPAN